MLGVFTALAMQNQIGSNPMLVHIRCYMKSKIKKTEQLGINPSTAQGRLVKDLLWDFICKADLHLCCKCGKEMTRETFSIEHIIPWLDSSDAPSLFFDLNNIGYSPLSCNAGDARSSRKI